MTEGIGYYFKVPSVMKEPAVYDDETLELDPICEAQAKALGEDETIRKQSIQQLREWIAKHPGIKRCRTDAPFMLRFLRTNKYSFLKSTKMLESFLVCRTVHKDWFHGLDVDDPDISRLIDGGYLFPLPQKDASGRTVFFSCASGFDPNRSSIASVIKVHHMSHETHYETNELQCAGYVAIFDMEKTDMSALGLLSMQDVHTLVDLFSNATSARPQELHFVNSQKVVRTFANMVLQLTSEKIRSRVFCHSSVESLHVMVDKSMLPKEFGGKIPASEMVAKYKETCRKMRPRLLILDKMEIEIKPDFRKMWKDGLNEIGHGSFRKLEVD